MSAVTMELFRYQLLPRDRFHEPVLFGEPTSLERQLARKNELFAEALRSVAQFRSRRSVIRHKLVSEGPDSLLFKLAANRSMTRETEDFTEEELPNWPAIWVIIWNDPGQQILAIQERRSAFQDTDIVARAIADAANEHLRESNLRVYVETMFLEAAFWDLVTANRGKIIDIAFELVTPNLANISEALSDELKALAKGTNAARTDLKIAADPDSAVLVSPQDPRVAGLVRYSSEGGGDISLKLRGFSKRVHTKRSRRRVDIDEIVIEGGKAEDAVNVLRELVR